MTKIFEKKRELKENESLAPQPTLILQILSKGPMDRAKLVATLDKKLEGKSVQSGTTLLSYWTKPLTEKGLIKVTRQADEAVAAAKPARKKAAAKNGE